MRTYTVHWEIELDAESPRDAAEQALRIHRDPQSLAIAFSIYDEGSGEWCEVDLLEAPLTR